MDKNGKKSKNTGFTSVKLQYLEAFTIFLGGILGIFEGGRGDFGHPLKNEI